MTKDEKIFTLRIDSDLLDYLRKRADINKRSIAKELEYIVENLRLRDKNEIEARADVILEYLNSTRKLNKEEIINMISEEGLFLPADEIMKNVLEQLKKID